MSDLTVSQPTAEKLKAAGWKRITKFCWLCLDSIAYKWVCILWEKELQDPPGRFDVLPAPTIGELHAELDSGTICRYILNHHSTHDKLRVVLMVLVADTMRSVKKLADVWRWKEGKADGQR